MSSKKIVLTATYAEFLGQLKQKVYAAQMTASIAVNKELILLYWEIGKSIVKKQELEGWGTSVISKLCADLQGAFPGMRGFSRANVFRMSAFYRAYSKVAQPVRVLNGVEDALPIVKIPWGHNVLIIQKIKDTDEALWYAQQVLDNNLSRHSLELFIKSKAYSRQGRAISNFAHTLPEAQSKLAQEVLKDPYNFDFLALDKNYREADLERGLVENVQKMMMELGKGFAFVGRQYHLELEGEDYYIDLLFYHVKLHCYCIVELKNTRFKPEYAGKLNFYLSAVDDLLKEKDDNPSIGILLCTDERKLTVEYALRGMSKPIGVSSYSVDLVESLPQKLQRSLPTIEEVEAELGFQACEGKKKPR